MPIAIKIKGDGGFSTVVYNPDDFLSALTSVGFTVSGPATRNLVRELWDSLQEGEIEVQTRVP